MAVWLKGVMKEVVVVVVVVVVILVQAVNLSLCCYAASSCLCFVLLSQRAIIT